VLHDRTWHGHVVKAHPEMNRHRDLVEAAVRSPEQIRLSQSDPDCRIYFGPGPRRGVKMMVVVDVSLGLVKTAHLAKRVSGGEQEWSR
jgi:hypothetical protein